MRAGGRSSMTTSGRARPRFLVRRTFQRTIYRPRWVMTTRRRSAESVCAYLPTRRSGEPADCTFQHVPDNRTACDLEPLPWLGRAAAGWRIVPSGTSPCLWPRGSGCSWRWLSASLLPSADPWARRGRYLARTCAEASTSCWARASAGKGRELVAGAGGQWQLRVGCRSAHADRRVTVRPVR